MNSYLDAVINQYTRDLLNSVSTISVPSVVYYIAAELIFRLDVTCLCTETI